MSFSCLVSSSPQAACGSLSPLSCLVRLTCGAYSFASTARQGSLTRQGPVQIILCGCPPFSCPVRDASTASTAVLQTFSSIHFALPGVTLNAPSRHSNLLTWCVLDYSPRGVQLNIWCANLAGRSENPVHTNDYNSTSELQPRRIG